MSADQAAAFQKEAEKRRRGFILTFTLGRRRAVRDYLGTALRCEPELLPWLSDPLVATDGAPMLPPVPLEEDAPPSVGMVTPPVGILVARTLL